MPEYINREALIEKIDTLKPSVFYADGNLDWYQEGFKDALKDVYKILENQPTADVAEVKHGEWKPFGYKWECSICRSRVNLDGTPNQNGLNYCPNCGAKMVKE